MTQPDEHVVSEVVQRLVSVLPIEKIILFGSRARGEANQDSDFDFLVVMDSDLSPLKRGIPVLQAGRIEGYPMDFIVKTPREMEEPFLLKKQILKDGVTIYERRNTSEGSPTFSGLFLHLNAAT